MVLGLFSANSPRYRRSRWVAGMYCVCDMGMGYVCGNGCCCCSSYYFVVCVCSFVVLLDNYSCCLVA